MTTDVKCTVVTVGLGVNQTALTNDLLASDAALSDDGRFCYVFDLDTVMLEPDSITVLGTAYH